MTSWAGFQATYFAVICQCLAGHDLIGQHLKFPAKTHCVSQSEQSRQPQAQPATHTILTNMADGNEEED